MNLVFEDGQAITVESKESGQWSVDGKLLEANLIRVSEHEYHLLRDNRAYSVTVESHDPSTQELALNINGERVSLRAKSRYEDLLKQLGMADMASAKAKDLKAPMPGLVLEVSVKAGDEVVVGDTLLVLEAMKMENVIKATADGTVSDITVANGDTVEKGQIMISF
jgi:biotin carboxyl carrier protein